MSEPRDEPGRAASPSFAAAFRFWLLLGFVNFGGPTGQIAIMHDELVERRRWIDEDRFLHALSFCMLLPGPEAQQLAVYVGWLLHGTAGGIVAGSLFIAPAALLMAGLAWLYAAHGQVDLIAGIFFGLSAAVIGIVASATITIGRRAIRTRPALAIAVAAFLAIWLVGLPFPLVVAGAGLAGLLLRPARLGVPEEAAVPDPGPVPALGRTIGIAAIGLAIWFVPLVAVAMIAGRSSVYAQEGLFFSQVAVVTFGGAYAVLAYVGHEVVRRFAIAPADVVAGLGLAETTPGPLILVLEFLGFLAAYRDPGSLSPLAAGLLGAVVTLWATFVPSFVFIFVGAPWVERLRANRRLRGALAGITASVVGVIASLALTLATAVLFAETVAVRPLRATILLPQLGSLRPLALGIAVAAFLAVHRARVHVVWVVLAAAAIGALARLV